jgi:hypothetical protein
MLTRLMNVALTLLFATTSGLGSIVTVDENGNGFIDSTPISGHLGNDPGPVGSITS